MYHNPSRTRRRYIAESKYKTGIASKNQLKEINAKFDSIEVGPDNKPYEVWRTSDGDIFRRPIYSLSAEKMDLYYAPTKAALPYYKFKSAKNVVNKISNAEFIEQTVETDRKGNPCKVNHYVDAEGNKFHFAQDEVNKRFAYYYEHKDEFAYRDK